MRTYRRTRPATLPSYAARSICSGIGPAAPVAPQAIAPGYSGPAPAWPPPSPGRLGDQLIGFDLVLRRELLLFGHVRFQHLGQVILERRQLAIISLLLIASWRRSRIT